MKRVFLIFLAVCLCLPCLLLTSCEEEPAHVHEWDNGKVTVSADCENAGERLFTCTGCDETKTESIAAIGHAWDEGTITVAPTREAAGTRLFTCYNCVSTRLELVEANTTVTDLEWGNAMELLAYDNFVHSSTGSVTVSNSGGQDGTYAFTAELRKNGEDIYCANETEGTGLQTWYYFIHGDAYYMYRETYPDPWDSATYVVGELEYRDTFKYDAFTYDEATRSYVAASVSSDLGVSRVFTQCSFQFLDGKLVGLSYTETHTVGETVGVTTATITITYGNADAIEIPANLSRPV